MLFCHPGFKARHCLDELVIILHKNVTEAKKIQDQIFDFHFSEDIGVFSVFEGSTIFRGFNGNTVPLFPPFHRL